MPTDSSAPAGGCLVGLLAAARTALFPATGHFIDRSPCATLGLFGAQAALLITFFNVLGLPFLFAGITGFITLWHDFNLVGNYLAKIMPTENPSNSYESFRMKKCISPSILHLARFCR
jgi:hypothetical protein